MRSRGRAGEENFSNDPHAQTREAQSERDGARDDNIASGARLPSQSRDGNQRDQWPAEETSESRSPSPARNGRDETDGGGPGVGEQGPNRAVRRRNEKLDKKVAIRVATLNINGFGNLQRNHPDNKWGNVYRMMNDAQSRIAVLMLQETHLTMERKLQLEKMFAGKVRIFHSPHPERPTQKEGVAIVVNRRLLRTDGIVERTIIPGRAIQLSVPYGGERPSIHILCIYAPTSEGDAVRRDFFKAVRQFYVQHPEVARPDIMGGDFNNVEDDIDRLPVNPSSDSSVEELDMLKQSIGLMMVDGWRETFPTEKAYTFMRGSGRAATLSRLDRIYTNEQTFRAARCWRIHEGGVRSDHSLVSVEIVRADAPELGRGRPVFPTGLLRDKKLAKQMKESGMRAVREINTLMRNNGRSDSNNPQTVLAELKRDWMKMARAREKEVVPRLLAEIQAREKALKTVRKAPGLSDETRAAETAALTEQIRKLREARFLKQKAGARARHRIEGERPTKYWVKIHRTIKPRDTMQALEREEARGLSQCPQYETDSKKMADLAREYHLRLQRDSPDSRPAEQREVDIARVLDAIDVSINNEQAAEMSEEISYAEVDFALRHSKSTSAPGVDGITYDVWKTLHARCVEDSRHEDREVFDVLGLLVTVFRDTQENGVSAKSGFTDGWMCPIYKGKGERTKIASYRPITLLNSDYKLLTKTMAVRL
ncbi:Endonuclease/exonuclease/phosphatase, partial [Daedaleopsis nitida]